MKILITQDTFAPSMDGPVYLPGNSFAELETDAARGIIIAGKGLYIDPKDDNTRIKQFTASESQVKAVREAVAAAKKSAKAEGAEA